jgi:hypothetical protein
MTARVMRHDGGRWLVGLVGLVGLIGNLARGVVFALAGVLVIDAAVTHEPGKSTG